MSNTHQKLKLLPCASQGFMPSFLTHAKGCCHVHPEHHSASGAMALHPLSLLPANREESYLSVLRPNELVWEGSKSSHSLKQSGQTVCFIKITSAKFLFSVYSKVAVSLTDQQIKKKKCLYCTNY